MSKPPKSLTTFLLIFTFLFRCYSMISLSYGAYVKAPQSPKGPTVMDDHLVVEKIRHINNSKNAFIE